MAVASIALFAPLSGPAITSAAPKTPPTAPNAGRAFRRPSAFAPPAIRPAALPIFVAPPVRPINPVSLS